MTDEINSPSHYMLFPDMEAIDVIKAALTPAEYIGYLKGNALKYRLRAGDKGPAEKCIAKACWYQNKLRDMDDAWKRERELARKGAPLWSEEAEARMDIVGQNGPSAEHYAEVTHA